MTPRYRVTAVLGERTLNVLAPDLPAASRAFLSWIDTFLDAPVAYGNVLEVDDGTDDGYASDPGTPYAHIRSDGAIFRPGFDGVANVIYQPTIEPASDRLPADFAGVEISSGTLRDVDLIDAFTSVLDTHAIDHPRYASARADFESDCANLALDELRRPGGLPDDERSGRLDDATHDYLEALFESLDELAPEGTSFGAHEGDGASFGFWPIDYQDEVL
jgi:hypothetical protein